MALPQTARTTFDATAPGPARLLTSLGAATDADPTGRKRLVGPDVNWGRELLVALARRRGGWIGWEATNLRGIASDLALVGLSNRGLRAAGDIEIASIVGRALDSHIEAGGATQGFAALQQSLGFRDLVRDAVLELRTAGITPGRLRDAADRGTAAHDVAGVLERYEALLETVRITDPAGVIAQALTDFDAEAPFVLDGEIHVAAGVVARGLAGGLLERLLAHGARPLASDPVVGVELPRRSASRIAREMELNTELAAQPRCSPLAWVGASTLPDAARVDSSAVAVDMFAAATPSDELCEVFRRVMAEGLRWDDVEIVATDTDAYGIALDALCQRLELGATMLRGIPFARTRLGRALDRWFQWLQEGLPADTLRQALEAGEIHLPDDDVAPTAIARELRWQQIGWGRARYESAIKALSAQALDPGITRYDEETDDEYTARVASRRRSAKALNSLLKRLLELIPAVPERGAVHAARTTTAALARATREWLELFAPHGEAEQGTKSRLDVRLADIAALDDQETSFSTALAALRLALSDLRAWPTITTDSRSWNASGGMVHLTDLGHAATTGRRRTFVVGLDAERTGGGSRQDPLLTEAVRTSLGGAVASLRERRDDRAFMVAAALAGLRGRVTLSYATSGSLDGREAGPAPVVLQAWRIILGDLAQTYETLRKALQPPACAVPEVAGDAPGRIVALDARDVWLESLVDGPLLLDGRRLLREGFAALAAGESARAAMTGKELCEHLGRGEPAGELLELARGVSPTALEKLAACPLAWFYRYGIGLRPPQDPEYDPERWLNAMDRGSALHDVYERFVTRYLGRRRDILHEDAHREILKTAERVIGEWREKVPPPSIAVFEAEAAEIRRAALVFLTMERSEIEDGDEAEWDKVEVAFGGSVGDHRYRAGARSLPIFGRADRVDRLPGGELRVIDYKTGRAGRYQRGKEAGVFKGGRHLQPALYADAVAQVTGMSVARFEYRFPTENGESTIVGYEAEELVAARGIVEGLLRHVENGWFVPTDDPGDCSYCDYRVVCRVHESGGRWAKSSSPRAEWAKANGAALPEFALMRANRGNGEVA
jgi:CRISPR/Cas system-associated exonuclease Cas4 (RecB family)